MRWEEGNLTSNPEMATQQKRGTSLEEEGALERRREKGDSRSAGVCSSGEVGGGKITRTG